MIIKRNTGYRIRRTGVAEVSDAEPYGPVTGEIWLDTDAVALPVTGSTVVDTITSSGTLTNVQVVVLCDAAGGAITATLPAVATITPFKVYYIKKIDSTANAVTIDGNASETIDDTTTRILSAQYDAVMIVTDGSEWWIL